MKLKNKNKNKNKKQWFSVILQLVKLFAMVVKTNFSGCYEGGSFFGWNESLSDYEELVKNGLLLRGQILIEFSTDNYLINRSGIHIFVFCGPDRLHRDIWKMYAGIISNVDSPDIRNLNFAGASKRNTTLTEIKNATDTMSINNECIGEFVPAMFSWLMAICFHVHV